MRAFGKRKFVTSLFLWSKFMLRVSEEVSTVATQGEHEKQLSIQTRGWNGFRSETGDGGRKDLLELHYFTTETRRHEGTSLP